MSGPCRVRVVEFSFNTLPGPSASEVTTSWRYTNVFILIIVIHTPQSVIILKEKKYYKKKKSRNIIIYRILLHVLKIRYLEESEASVYL